jgi:methionyl-tRNA formyltransferase
MGARQSFDCYLIGTESLLISCAEVLTSRGHAVLGVISDDPGISDWCGSQGLRVIPPAPGYAAVLAETPFDYLFSITNLRIVPAAALALPRCGAVNFHDGPLPRYGGLYAPAWALMDGASEHGITWHEMTAGVDEGRVLLQRRFAVGPDDTSLDLNTRCFEAGIDSFPALMDLLENGAAEPVRHTLDRSTWHGLSDRPRGHGWLDWDRPARELAARVRALDFGPYANPLCVPKIVSATGVVLARTLVGIEPGTAVPGTIVAAGPDELRVAAADGTLVLSRLATMDGAPLDPAAALIALDVAVGEVLPPLDAARADAVDDLVRQAVRHEGFWTARLASLNAPELPYADRRATGGSRYAVQPLGRPGTADATVEAFMLFLARLTGRPSVDVAFAEHGSIGATGGLAAFMSPCVPFRVELDEAWSVDDARAAVAAGLATVRSRRGFFRDAVVRQPALKSLAGRGFSLPVSILLVPSLEECPAPAGDLVLCVAADGDGRLELRRRRAGGGARRDHGAPVLHGSPPPATALGHGRGCRSSTPFSCSRCSRAGTRRSAMCHWTGVSTSSSRRRWPARPSRSPSFSRMRRSPMRPWTRGPTSSRTTCAHSAPARIRSSACAVHAPSTWSSACSASSRPARRTFPWTPPTPRIALH